MDVKDLRIETGLNTHINDGSIKYAPSGKIPQAERKTFNSNIELQSLGKLDSQGSRPCAIIGPDRVIPPPISEGYGKTGPEELWPCPDVYRQLYELPLKMSEFQPSRNISPRQTFQENMQRIMVPPTYSSIKNSDEPSLKNKNMPPEAKYCDVPFNVNNEHKSVRNSDIPVNNVNPPFRSVPGNGWPGVSVRPIRPYPAPDFYQYPEYSNLAGPRQMPIVRPQRIVHEEPAQIYPERLYQESNLRFKPYPTVKERYPHTRYEYNISSCPNAYPPPPSYPPHKSIQNHPPYPIYPQVPLKYLDRRMPEPIMDGFQRPNPHVNVNTFRNHLPPPYGPIPSNCYQNKSYPYQSDSSKSVQLNKLSYDTNNRVYLDLDNCRSKMYPENFYYNDRSQLIRGDIVMSGHPPVNSVSQHQMYRKDNTLLKNYDYGSHYRNIDQLQNNSSLSRLPLQFSPNTIAISPCDSNASNETAQTLGTLQEDCGYVSQSSTTSLKSFDNGITNDIYRRHDYPNMTSLQNQINNSELNSKSNTSNKKSIDVRQFLQMWNEGDEDADNNKEITIQKSSNSTNNEELYVLGLVNVPNEELAKYDHLQKLSKLPENIKGYNYIELLNQYEQIVESPSFNNINGKPISKKEYPIQTKSVNVKTNKDFLPRPISPLDVEAKISQSIIHKEVGCNFEIKPCSPKLLNVDIATPVHSIMTERLIEKVTNPVLVNVKDNNNDTSINSIPPSCNLSKQYSVNSIKSNQSNYNLQELETNTSVCLASLPQLDNDIELNFPEVNQQFINSTKTDISKSTNSQNVTENKPDFKSYPDSIPSNNNNTEKECSKLSKYRKTKKIELPSKDTGSTTKESHSPSSIQQRIDSVIIKNPDNTKVNNDNNILQKDRLMHEDITHEYVECPKYSLSSNLVSNEDSRTYYDDLPLETAIDFSLNKTEHTFSRNDYKDINDKKEDFITDTTMHHIDKKKDHNIIDHEVQIYKNDLETQGSQILDTLNEKGKEPISQTNDLKKIKDCINNPTVKHVSKTKEITDSSVQNKVDDKNENNNKFINTTLISDSLSAHENYPALCCDISMDCIVDTTLNNLNKSKVNDLNKLIDENKANAEESTNITDTVVKEKIDNANINLNKCQDNITGIVINHPTNAEQDNLNDSICNITKNKIKDEDFHTQNSVVNHDIETVEEVSDKISNQINETMNTEKNKHVVDTMAYRQIVDNKNTELDVNDTGPNIMINENTETNIEVEDQLINTLTQHKNDTSIKEPGSTLSKKTLDSPESNEKYSSKILNNNLIHNNSLINNFNLTNEVFHKVIDPVLSEGKKSPDMCLKYQSGILMDKISVENMEYVEYLPPKNDNEFTQASNNLFINSSLNSNNLSEEFDDRIKDLELFENSKLEENSVLNENQSLPENIYSEKQEVFQDYINLELQKKCDAEESFKCDINVECNENNYFEEATIPKEHNGYLAKEDNILNAEITLKENSSIKESFVTLDVIEDNSNTNLKTENKNNDVLVKEQGENINKESENLLIEKCKASFSEEADADQEVTSENNENMIKENKVKKEDEIISSMKENETLDDIPSDEMQTCGNECNSDIVEQKIILLNSDKAKDIMKKNSDEKNVTQISDLEQNIPGKSVELNTTQLIMKFEDTSSNNISNIQKSTNKLFDNVENNSSNTIQIVEHTINKLLKMELKPEYSSCENETLNNSGDINTIKCSENCDIENLVEQKEILQQSKLSSPAYQNASENEMFKPNEKKRPKQSKEWYSPWIQKLLLCTEGKYLPMAQDSSTFTKSEMAHYIKPCYMKSNEPEFYLENNFSQVSINQNCNNVISKGNSCNNLTDSDSNKKEIKEFLTDNLQLVHDISDDDPISSNFIQNKQISNDISESERDKKTSKDKFTPLKESMVIKRSSLKRSLSESALEAFYENEDRETLFPKRPKLLQANLCNIFQSNRRNSISEIYNEDSLYILIEDNNYVITEDAREKVCYTDIMHINTHVDTSLNSVHTLSENVLNDNYEIYDSPFVEQRKEENAFEETWVDGNCIETMFNDDIAEDIVISAPGSPDDSVISNCETNKDTLQCEDVIDHMEKVKDIYGGNMCNLDAKLVETLYRTPQMNVKKTLKIECPDTELISLNDIISNTENEEIRYEHLNLVPEDFASPLPDTILGTDNNDSLDKAYEIVNEKEYFEAENISDIDNIHEANDNIKLNIKTIHKSDINYTIHSNELIDESYKSYEKSKCSTEYYISSSPEVTSTTSEEKNTSILFKISSSSGSQMSQNEDRNNKKISYKLTESNNYKTLNANYNSAGVLITKAAQKYIPPIKETISNLKVKLHLPQHSLNKLKQLKKSKVEPKINKMLPIPNNIITKHDIVKKQKPKFEDVLMNIDKIQLKKCKEKFKKVKEVIPKMVIKKNESGAHYTSSSNTNTKNKYNPDLTGRKWQPWVFLEKNIFIDKMAIRNKQKAIYCHRKKEYVLIEKFRKYKSVYNANFIISKPELSDKTKGNLKYTIRLKGK